MSEQHVTCEDAAREVAELLSRPHDGRAAERRHVIVAGFMLAQITEPDNTIRRMVLDQLLIVLREQFDLPALH